MKPSRSYFVASLVVIVGLFAFLAGRPLIEKQRVNRLRSLIKAGDADGVSQLVGHNPQLLNADLGERHGDNLKALSIAASLGKVSICSNLIRLGANVNEQDKYRYTPLHYAAMADQTDTAAFLIQQRADPTMKDFQGMTPADVARKFNASSNLIQMIQSSGGGRL